MAIGETEKETVRDPHLLTRTNLNVNKKQLVFLLNRRENLEHKMASKFLRRVSEQSLKVEERQISCKASKERTKEIT